MGVKIDQIKAQGGWTTAQLTVAVRFVRPARATEGSPTNSEPGRRAAAARDFVVSAEVAEPPLRSDLTKATGLHLDAAKEQAAVVGSNLISFVKGVSPEQRSDIVNASLLAQLAADRRLATPETLNAVNAWYDAYFDVLSHIGFAVQDVAFARYEEKNPDFEAHEAILDIAAVLLAGSPEALSLVKRSLDTLREMSDSNSEVILFNRAGQSANTSRFQITLVDQDESRQLRVFVLAFGLEAKSRPTQLLFFKFHSDQVTVQHYSSRFSVDADVLASVREPIAGKVAPFRDQYVGQLLDL